MPGKNEITSFIRKQLHEHRFKNLLSLWRERDNSYSLFDTRKDFSFNAKSYINSEENANNYLSRLGLEVSSKQRIMLRNYLNQSRMKLKIKLRYQHVHLNY